MTGGSEPLSSNEAGNRLPRSVAKRIKEEEADARRAILAPVRTRLNAASVIMASAAVCAVAPFILIVELCRELLDDDIDTDRVWLLLFAAVGTLGLHILLQASAMTLSHLTDAGFQLSLRRALAEKLTRVPLGWFGSHSSGEVKRYLQDDVEALHYLVAHARLEFVGAVVVPVVTLAYLIAVEWRLALLVLLPLVVYAILLSRMMDQPSRDRLAIYNRWVRRAQSTTIEYIDGIQVVRAFGQAGKAHRTFQDSIDGQAKSLGRFKTPMITLQATADIIISPVFVMLLIMIGGLIGVGREWFDAIDILPFLLVGLGLGSAVMGLGYSSQTLREASAAAKRLHEIQQEPELPSTVTPSGAVADGTVRFDSVTFGYRSDRMVLHDITFELRPGTITALVGPSGSGKSTLAALLPRFYDVGAGRITIGGQDIREVDSEELYRTVGFVFQDVRLIAGTVRENLLLARPDADSTALENAARAAHIHERIVALPRGYDSEIGVDALLSGGEAQRLSIARTLLADTPVLVLDEATAFADPESEAAVQDALATLVAGRTVLVIAHRLGTITGVDQILVLDNGSIVERGAHGDLRNAGGLYQTLWEIDEAALGAMSATAIEENR
ncbi:ABC transporter ATP-binding protein [Rhodococcoides kyotonense]|uniref:ATP-binding cassette, subfamily B/ATP-binding cassette, subfamily B, IrtA n=1 Tax=Rhodococcoides kyotonense TaxID=398843 RepID=A0A239N3T9_9NOCA|nr:ABC transporter ATP-binding protein [Rhodococcus kyotonensis]SNT49113.1 ATP-binding cassette, subfamily B/ATP-binding cassette, subfamily B, IrtA [Rhodococcus kyotonensis]